MTYNEGESLDQNPKNWRVHGSITGAAAGTITVNGIGARDVLISVCATTEGDITSGTTITAANQITTTVDTTGETVTVMWLALQ